jgi:hypothetical protein
MAIGPKGFVPEYTSHRVPIPWQSVVCTCGPEDHGTKHDLTRTLNMLCRKCSKLKRFYASYCSRCHEFYTMTFTHPLWQASKDQCWDCLEIQRGEKQYPSYSWQPSPAWIHATAPLTAAEFKNMIDSGFELDLDF